MTFSINNQKRIASYEESASKRLKDEAPGHPFISSWLSLTKEQFPLSLTIQSIGTLSQVSKDTYQIAQQFFAPKALELGFQFENARTAKFWWKRLYSVAKGIQFPDDPTLTSEAKTRLLTRLNHVSLLILIAWPVLYSVPNHPLLELLEDPRYWKHAASTPLSLSNHVKGYAALSFAVYKGRSALVNRLLESGARTDIPVLVSHPEKKQTYLPRPLHLAVLSGDLEMVKALLEKKPNLNVNYPAEVARLPETPVLSLLECALGGSRAREYHDRASLHVPMVQFLIERGVKPTIRDMIAAAEVASMEVMDLFLKNGGMWTPDTATKAVEFLIAFSAANDSSKAMFQFLLKQGADLDSPIIFYQHPLQIAILRDDIEWVQLIVDHINLEETLEVKNAYLGRPLHRACLRGNIPIIEILIKAGADVNAVHEEEVLSPLSFACLKNHSFWISISDESTKVEMVKLLLSHGAKPRLEHQSKKNSPLYLAKKNGFKEIVRVLKKHIAAK